MTWIRNSYKEGSLTPEELAGEIVRRAEKYRDYNIWIVAPDLKRMMDYIEKLPKIWNHFHYGVSRLQSRTTLMWRDLLRQQRVRIMHMIQKKMQRL